MNWSMFVILMFLPLNVTAQMTSRFANISQRFNEIPKLENGVVCSTEILDPVVLAVHAATGQIVTSARIAIPDASRVQLSSCAVSRDGRLTVAGGGYDTNGRIAAFIAFVDSAGKIGKTIRFEDFAPARIDYSGDGKLWAVGIALNPQQTQREANLVVKRFNPDGSVTQSIHVPYSANERIRGGFAKPSVTFSGADLVIYRREWKELVFVPLANGGSLRRSAFDDPDNANNIVIGFFGTPAGELYLKVQADDNRSGKRVQTGILRRWSRSQSQWEVIDASEHQNTSAILGWQNGEVLSGFLASYKWQQLP